MDDESAVVPFKIEYCMWLLLTFKNHQSSASTLIQDYAFSNIFLFLRPKFIIYLERQPSKLLLFDSLELWPFLEFLHLEIEGCESILYFREAASEHQIASSDVSYLLLFWFGVFCEKSQKLRIKLKQKLAPQPLFFEFFQNGQNSMGEIYIFE